MTDQDGDKHCPRCGEDLEPLIDYVMGHKTSAGWSCENCGYEEVF